MARQPQRRPAKNAISLRNIQPPSSFAGHQAPPPPPKTYHRELVKRSRRLNIGQSLLQILELQIDLLLGSLGIVDGLDLKRINGLELATQVVRGGLEGDEALLDLVDDGLVLEDAAVVREVDLGRLLREHLHLAADVFVALLERLEARHRLAAKAERRGNLGPVELESCASLWREREREAEN